MGKQEESGRSLGRGKCEQNILYGSIFQLQEIEKNLSSSFTAMALLSESSAQVCFFHPLQQQYDTGSECSQIINVPWRRGKHNEVPVYQVQVTPN